MMVYDTLRTYAMVLAIKRTLTCSSFYVKLQFPFDESENKNT